jgi:hypothetical protein
MVKQQKKNSKQADKPSIKKSIHKTHNKKERVKDNTEENEVAIDKSIAKMFEVGDDEGSDNEESVISNTSNLDFEEEEYISDTEIAHEKEAIEKEQIDAVIKEVQEAPKIQSISKLVRMMKTAISSAEEESTIDEPKIWNKILVHSFKHLPNILCSKLNESGKAPSSDRDKFVLKKEMLHKLEKVVKLYLKNCLSFLEKANDQNMIAYVLSYAEPLAYILPHIKQYNKKFTIALLKIWGRVEQTAAQPHAFTLLRKISTRSDDSFYQFMLNVNLLYRKHTKSMYCHPST